MAVATREELVVPAVEGVVGLPLEQGREVVDVVAGGRTEPRAVVDVAVVEQEDVLALGRGRLSELPDHGLQVGDRRVQVRLVRPAVQPAVHVCRHHEVDVGEGHGLLPRGGARVQVVDAAVAVAGARAGAVAHGVVVAAAQRRAGVRRRRRRRRRRCGSRRDSERSNAPSAIIAIIVAGRAHFPRAGARSRTSG